MHLPQTSFNFDSALSDISKHRGITITQLNNKDFLEKARQIARELARNGKIITVDDVRKETEKLNISPKSSAAWGALFNLKDWIWTGNFTKSTYISNHSRMVRTWKLKIKE